MCRAQSGKRCVSLSSDSRLFASLNMHAGRSTSLLSFEFWQLLVKNNVEHSDYKQRAARARIARNIRRHVWTGRLSRNRARSMLLELGENPEIDEERLRAEEAAGAAKDRP